MNLNQIKFEKEIAIANGTASDHYYQNNARKIRLEYDLNKVLSDNFPDLKNRVELDNTKIN